MLPVAFLTGKHFHETDKKTSHILSLMTGLAVERFTRNSHLHLQAQNSLTEIGMGGRGVRIGQQSLLGRL